MFSLPMCDEVLMHELKTLSDGTRQWTTQEDKECSACRENLTEALESLSDSGELVEMKANEIRHDQQR